MVLDTEVLQITLLSLRISATATAISLLLGLPLGTLLGLGNFRGRSLLLSLVNTGMGLPPVVVGLVVAMSLWRKYHRREIHYARRLLSLFSDRTKNYSNRSKKRLEKRCFE